MNTAFINSKLLIDIGYSLITGRINLKRTEIYQFNLNHYLM